MERLILGINNHRRPAQEAVFLYEESPDSIFKRQEQRVLQKTQRQNT